MVCARFSRPMPLLRSRPNVRIIAVLAMLGDLAFSAEKPDVAGFARVAQPFIKENCVACHGPEKQKGKLRLDTLANDFSDPATAGKWKEVVNSVNGHEMPPEDEKQPAPE